jgi:uncharacterized Tic20 family protein
MAETNETPAAAQEPGTQTSAQQSVSAEQPQVGKEINRDACMWAMFCHLAGLGGFLPIAPILGGVIAPLIIWQIKKNDFKFVDEQGKEAVNFQISIVIYALVAGLLCFACIGVFLLPAVYIFDVVFLLIAAVKANNGEHYRYPLTIRFIK